MDTIKFGLDGDGSRIGLVIGAFSFVAVFFSVEHLVGLARIVSATAGRLRLKQLKRRGNSDRDATVTQIFVYPVKSLKAVPLEEATIDNKGLVGDRRFMVVSPRPPPNFGDFGPMDATHQFMTQRQIPSLATIKVDLSAGESGTLTLSSHLLDHSVSVPAFQLVSSGKSYRARIWDDVTEVVDLGDDAAAFLAKVAAKDQEAPPNSEKVRLVSMKKDDRVADDKYTPNSALSWTGSLPKVSLTDGFPVLITSEASLSELNRRLQDKGKDAIPMSRFRPNIVVSGTKLKPFEEDTWKIISIDGVLFHIVKGCPRCKQSCTDQDTGKVSEEPLETLAEFRAIGPMKENVYFAQNAIAHDEGGTIRVGAAVYVLERGDPVWDS